MVVVSTSCTALNRRISHVVEQQGWTSLYPAPNRVGGDILLAVVGSSELTMAKRYTDAGVPVVAMMYGAGDPVWYSPDLERASGVVDRDEMDADFAHAFRVVAGGGHHVSSEFAGHVLSLISSRNTLTSVELESLERLSSRESEVVALAARGATNIEIAGALTIEVSTVKFHVSNILRKLGCKDRTELITQIGPRLPPGLVSLGKG